MGLREILAAKAAAEGASKTEAPLQVEMKQAVAVAAVDSTPAAAVAPTKTLSFAEKMALKKTEAAKAIEAPIQPVVAAFSLDELVAPIPVAVDTSTLIAARMAELDSSVSESDKTAYVDIVHKVAILESIMDPQLENAMKELKTALMKNPSAVSLMHDTDIGKMVIALRRLTKEAQIQAETDKKPGRKAKDKLPTMAAMTPEDIAAAFKLL